jgi:hypothetical protein
LLTDHFSGPLVAPPTMVDLAAGTLITAAR